MTEYLSRLSSCPDDSHGQVDGSTHSGTSSQQCDILKDVTSLNDIHTQQ